jgi:hypothetical protein
MLPPSGSPIWRPLALVLIVAVAALLMAYCSQPPAWPYYTTPDARGAY